MDMTRIETNPSIMLGKPLIKGTRVTVELVLRRLSEGLSVEALIEAYPQLSKDDVYAALIYASNHIANEEIIILKAS